MRKKSIATMAVSVILGTSLLIAGAASIGNADGNETENKNTYAELFSDVKESDWFCEDVQYVCEQNLMKGMSDREFSPNGSTTRGMIVTILWRLENEPDGNGKDFEDVSRDAYYHDAVLWASGNNIVSGYNDTQFGPDDTATREQFATMMYRYAAYKNYDVSDMSELGGYTDKEQISEYALNGIKWANAAGLITGTADTTISPKDNVQRCQVAAILKRFCLNIKNDEKTNVFETENTAKKDESKYEADMKKNNNQTEIEDVSDKSETTEPKITVDNAIGKAGDTVELSVKVKNNPGILGMILTLYYDDSVCTLESAENGEAVKDVLDMTPSKNLINGARFVWDGVEIKNDEIKDGDILKLRFKIKEDTKGGTCPITVKFFNDDIVDNELLSIYPVIENGQIIITE